MLSSRTVIRLGAAVSAVAGTVYVVSNASKGGRFEPSSIGIVRFGRAATTVVKIAADYKWSLSGLDRNSEEYRLAKSEAHTRSANQLLDLCCKNGGLFIKVGQHIGALDYLLPAEYVQTLKVLHSRAPKSDFADVLHVLREDLKKEPSEIFSHLEQDAIGAASLAQVHKATLHDGTTVAVKVQHRYVLDHSAVDMRTMEFLVNWVAKLFPEFSFLWLAEETKINLPLELDFVQEGHNAERVCRMFSKFKWLKIPQIYWNYSSKKVLTMEYCEGGEIHDKDYIISHHISPAKISQRLGELYSEMIFVQGYVHCDPHPGNILIKPLSNGDSQIVLLDHGLYTTLPDAFRLSYSKLWKSLIEADINGLKRAGIELGVGDMYGLLACILSGRSWQSVSKGVEKTKLTKDEQNHISSYAAAHLTDITELLNRVPREMYLIFKTNDLLRAIETYLGVSGAASSFITMSRCCIKAIGQENLNQCPTFYGRLCILIGQNWMLFKISLYQLSSRIRNTFLGGMSIWKFIPFS